MLPEEKLEMLDIGRRADRNQITRLANDPEALDRLIERDSNIRALVEKELDVYRIHGQEIVRQLTGG